MPQATNETDPIQKINEHIQSMGVFLRNYHSQTINYRCINAEEVQRIKDFITAIVEQGTVKQQHIFYFMLVGTRAQLGARELEGLRQPIAELTHFFQRISPDETQKIDTELKESLRQPRNFFGTSAAAA